MFSAGKSSHLNARERLGLLERLVISTQLPAVTPSASSVSVAKAGAYRMTVDRPDGVSMCFTYTLNGEPIQASASRILEVDLEVDSGATIKNLFAMPEVAPEIYQGDEILRSFKKAQSRR